MRVEDLHHKELLELNPEGRWGQGLVISPLTTGNHYPARKRR